MLVTIAFVTIISAIFIFFSEELLAYAKSLVSRPFWFLGFSLLLASSLLVMYERFCLLTVVSYWIALLELTQWLARWLWLQSWATTLAEWLVLVILSSIPTGLVWLLVHNKKSFLVWIQRSYEIGLVIGLITLLLLVVGAPGSGFSG